MEPNYFLLQIQMLCYEIFIVMNFACFLPVDVTILNHDVYFRQWTGLIYTKR